MSTSANARRFTITTGSGPYGTLEHPPAGPRIADSKGYPVTTAPTPVRGNYPVVTHGKTRGTYHAHAATSQRSLKTHCGTIQDPPKALLSGYRNITGPTSLNYSSMPGGSPPLHRRRHRRNISPQKVGSETQNYQLHFKKALTFVLFLLCWSYCTINFYRQLNMQWWGSHTSRT
jgi:hypothetical protein